MNKNTDTGTDGILDKLTSLIKDVKFAMLTTVDSDGSLHSCPMTTLQSEKDGSLWFFINKSAHKISEIQKDSHVNASYSMPDDHIYVSVSGRAHLVDDRKKTEELWSPAYKAWFKDGLEDPNLGLLKIDIDKAEYWDSPSSGVVHLVGFAKAMITGQTPAKVGEHQKVNLQ